MDLRARGRTRKGKGEKTAGDGGGQEKEGGTGKVRKEGREAKRKERGGEKGRGNFAPTVISKSRRLWPSALNIY